MLHTYLVSSKIFGTHRFQPFFTEEKFHIQYELFIGYNLFVRKMKELLLNNFVSNAKKSTTFSMNTGPDFHCDLFLEFSFGF